MKISNKNYEEYSTTISGSGLIKDFEISNQELKGIEDYSDKSFKASFTDVQGWAGKSQVCSSFYKAVNGVNPPPNSIVKFVNVPQVWSVTKGLLSIKIAPQFVTALKSHI